MDVAQKNLQLGSNMKMSLGCLLGTRYSLQVRVMGLFSSHSQLTVHVAQDSPAAPYVKAAARDLKAYRDSKGYRKIPIGYSAGWYSLSED